MTDVLKQLAAIGRVHLNIAREVYPRGALLLCQKCAHTQGATTEDCARYLARGWPMHCGQDMKAERPTNA